MDNRRSEMQKTMAEIRFLKFIKLNFLRCPNFLYVMSNLIIALSNKSSIVLRLLGSLQSCNPLYVTHYHLPFTPAKSSPMRLQRQSIGYIRLRSISASVLWYTCKLSYLKCSNSAQKLLFTLILCKHLTGLLMVTNTRKQLNWNVYTVHVHACWSTMW